MTSAAVGVHALGADAPVQSDTARRERLAGVLRRHRAAVAVAVAFVLAATLVVPLWAPVAVNDDWVYARSVTILLRDGELRTLELSAAAAIFQVLWAAPFALIFGLSFGSLRLSTVTLFLISGGALYWMLLQLGVSRARSALGMAAYVFNPLAFVLAFTFMTDSHLCSMVVISAALYVRAFAGRAVSPRWLLAASVAASCAFLVRQHAALLPLAVGGWLLLSGQLRPDRRSAALIAQVAGLPALTLSGYYAWLNLINGGSPFQESFTAEIRAAGLGGTVRVLSHLGLIEAMYLGLFAVPLVIGGVGGFLALVRTLRRGRLALFGVWCVALMGGLLVFEGEGRRMPYVDVWLGAFGLGADDLVVQRPPLPFVGIRALALLTVLCLLAAGLVGGALLARSGHSRRERASLPGLVLALGLGQAAAAAPESFHFSQFTATKTGLALLSIDRHLLPLVPFVICLCLVALSRVRLRMGPAWVAVALVAAFAVVGTRDYLVFHRDVWRMAAAANAAGIANVHLDAGAGWDGEKLSNGRGPQANPPPRTPGHRWWTDLFAPLTDSQYVIGAGPVDGYDVVERREYSSWLQPKPVYLYLVRRTEPLPTAPAAP